MSEEIESVYKNQIWELVKTTTEPKDCWVQMGLQKKEEIPKVEAVRFKIYLVAKGYSQREGIDFNNFFLL